MIKKSERLKVIIDLHARQEQDALQALGRSQQKLLEQQTQLENLQKYRLEYQRKVEEKQKAGMNVNQLLEFRAFADKLDKAIGSQQSTVSAHEQDLQRVRIHWEESHQRTKSLTKVSELARLEELKAENRLEQLEQDAHAARSSRKDGIGNA